MKYLRQVAITGTGMYVPPRKVTNSDLESLMDTSDQWIRQRSGVEARQHVDEGVGNSDLALKASLKALQSADLEAKDLDLIILATLSPDHQFPGSSAILQAKLGLSTTPAMDVRCQCTGFLYALNTAKLFVGSGQYDRILVVGSEVHSPVIDMTTAGRDVSVLFGDGAGAVIVESVEGSAEIGEFALHTQGEFASKLWLERPGTAEGRWINDQDIEERRHFPHMDGRYVFKHAVTRLTEVVKECLASNQLAIEDIDHFLFHQANLRINEKVGSVLKIPSEKAHNNIMKYGNCSAASIPILLNECVSDGRIKKGQKVLMAAFGAGFTWGSAVITW